LLAIGKAQLPARVAALQHENHAMKGVGIAADRVPKVSFTLLRLSPNRSQDKEQKAPDDLEIAGANC
jgi:hypothetical protein